MKYQFFIVSLALLVRSVVPQGDGAGNCHAPCHEVCNGENPGRFCSPIGTRNDYFVDPWMCGEPRCQQVFCRDCGDTAHCIAVCEQFRIDNDIVGVYPQCRKECRKIDTPMKCFQKCTRLPEFFPKPPCELYDCSEAYCDSEGRQRCNARGILINPIDGAIMRDGPKCPNVPCSKCGDRDHCVFHCDQYNQKEGTSYDCDAVCREIDSEYICINMPPEYDIIG